MANDSSVNRSSNDDKSIVCTNDLPFNVFQSPENSSFVAGTSLSRGCTIAGGDINAVGSDVDNVDANANMALEKQPTEELVSTIDLESKSFIDSHVKLESPDMEEFLMDNESGYYDHCHGNQEVHSALPVEESRSGAKINIDDLIRDDVMDSPVRVESRLSDTMTNDHLKCFHSNDESPSTMNNEEVRALPIFGNHIYCSKDTTSSILQESQTQTKRNVTDCTSDYFSTKRRVTDDSNCDYGYPSNAMTMPQFQAMISRSSNNVSYSKKEEPSNHPPLPMLGNNPIIFSRVRTQSYTEHDSSNASSYTMQPQIHPANFMAQQFSPISSNKSNSYPHFLFPGEVAIHQANNYNPLYAQPSNLDNYPPTNNHMARRGTTAAPPCQSNGQVKRKRDEMALGPHNAITTSSSNQSSGLLNLLCNVSVNFGSRLDIGCKCSRTRCLKLYCDCFQSGKVCISTCACNSCLNTKEESGDHGERTKAIHSILNRRPDAFQKREKNADAGCACKNSK